LEGMMPLELDDIKSYERKDVSTSLAKLANSRTTWEPCWTAAAAACMCLNSRLGNSH